MPQFRTRIVRPSALTSRGDGDELVATSVAMSRNGLNHIDLMILRQDVDGDLGF